MAREGSDDPGNNDSNQVRESNRSGGVNITGGDNEFKGDIAGRDIIKSSANVTEADLNELFKSLNAILENASAENREVAKQKADELKEELAKGENADDSRVAKLIDGIIDLVPGALSAVVGMFATPILSGLVGPVTKFVLDKIRGK